MTAALPAPTLDAYLDQARAVILPLEQARLAGPLAQVPAGPLRVGVDLGTAYLVLVVLAEDGTPLAGEWQYAEVARDGLVVDFIGAVDRLREMKARVERRLGRPLEHGATGYPPGVPRAEVRATANVLEAAGLACTGLLDEPSAANLVLRQAEGVIADVGGGTTGVAVLRGGEVIYTADEATGGTHFSLVLAGSQGIPFAEAERLKTDLSQQPRLLPVVRPVMEKVASIIQRHAAGRADAGPITLVGGGSAFYGMADAVQEYTGIPTRVAPHPALVTPLGLAWHDNEN